MLSCVYLNDEHGWDFLGIYSIPITRLLTLHAHFKFDTLLTRTILSLEKWCFDKACHLFIRGRTWLKSEGWGSSSKHTIISLKHIINLCRTCYVFLT